MRGLEEADVTARTLRTLREHEPDVDVIVVDDCSPSEEALDGVRAVCEKLDAELWDCESNEGFSATVNVGMERAHETGRDAILVNADLEFVMPFVDAFTATTGSDGEPAGVVGALLLYPSGLIQHGGIYFCQPGDTLVSTAKHGSVALRDLDPEVHGLVTYNKDEHKIYRRATRAGRWSSGWKPLQNGGYPFKIGARPYRGDMLEIDTRAGTTRVTPNHKLTVFWSDEALASHVVYLMRRGRDWRIGRCLMRHGRTSFGPRMRMLQQDADSVWILRANLSKDEAMYYESLLSWEYGVPTWQFIAGKAGRGQQVINDLWKQADSETGALAALAAHGRRLECPVDQRERGGIRRYPVGSRRRYPIMAGALIPEAMRVLTDGGHQTPETNEFTVSADSFDGDVYSMDVHPYEHYVSQNIVLHNSFYERAFDHKFRYGPAGLPEAHEPRVCPVTGALQYIRHSTLERVGLYDTTFRMGFEDVDYCLRVFEEGLECIYQPTVRAIHHESLFRGQKSDKLDEWHQTSLSALYEKHATTSLGRYVPQIA